MAASLYFLYRQHNFPKLSSFPNGKARVDGEVFGVFGANGWTGMLIAVAGGLLLFGAAQHLLAKTISLIVGVVLAVAAGDRGCEWRRPRLGCGQWVDRVRLGVVAAILLLNTVIPRRRKTVAVVEARGASSVARDTRAAQPVGATRPSASTGAGARTGAARDPVADREGPYADESGAAADDPEVGEATREAPRVESQDPPRERPA